MTKTGQIRIFFVDDHPLLHEGLATVIRHQPDMVLVAEAYNGREALQLFREHTPDVTLMDLRLPDVSGLDTMVSIRAEFPEARVIILTTFASDVEIERAVEAGARGYMLKSMPPKELMQVIREVHAGNRVFPHPIGYMAGPDVLPSSANNGDEPQGAPIEAEEQPSKPRLAQGFQRFTDWLRRK